MLETSAEGYENRISGDSFQSGIRRQKHLTEVQPSSRTEGGRVADEICTEWQRDTYSPSIKHSSQQNPSGKNTVIPHATSVPKNPSLHCAHPEFRPERSTLPAVTISKINAVTECSSVL